MSNIASVIEQKIEAFTYSNVVELYNQWLPSTTYTFEEEAPYTNASAVLHRSFYWRSTSTENLNNEPIDEKGNVSSEWVVISPANLASILDSSSNSKGETIGTDLIVEFVKTYEIQTLAVGRFMARQIIVDYLDNLGNIITTDTFDFEDEIFADVIDDLTYDYSPIDEVIDKNKLLELKLAGNKIRLTFTKSPVENKAYVSFLTGGTKYELGTVDGEIQRTSESYLTTKVDQILGTKFEESIRKEGYSFNTLYTRAEWKNIGKKLPNLKTKVNTYILDGRNNDEFENIIVQGKVESHTDAISTLELIQGKWAIEESI